MQMLIGGKFVDASDGGKLDIVNPATGEVIDSVPAGTLDDLDKAISLAVEGQKEWNNVPLHEKTRILEKYACLIEENVEEIAKIIQPQFEENDLDTITTIVKRYYDQDTWKADLIFEKESFELLQDILEDSDELSKRAPYQELVDTSFAEKAKDL